MAFSIVIVGSADAFQGRLKLVIRELRIFLFVAEVFLVEICIGWEYESACAIYVQPLRCGVPDSNSKSLGAVGVQQR